jgi:hypothetical protein
MRLPADVARCSDKDCHDRLICARFLLAISGRVHVATLREPGAASCASLILLEDPGA